MDISSMLNLDNIFIQGGIVMVATNFIVSMLKKWVNVKWLPLFALFLPAIGGAIYGAVTDSSVVDLLIKGLAVGAASMGAYDVVKTVKKK